MHQRRRVATIAHHTDPDQETLHVSAHRVRDQRADHDGRLHPIRQSAHRLLHFLATSLEHVAANITLRSATAIGKRLAVTCLRFLVEGGEHLLELLDIAFRVFVLLALEQPQGAVGLVLPQNDRPILMSFFITPLALLGPEFAS